MGFPSDRLPITRRLTLAYVLSLVIALLIAIASAAGLFYQSYIYPSDDLRLTFVPNDVVNLVIGLPALIGSMWFAWRGKLTGLLLWPGALFLWCTTTSPTCSACPSTCSTCPTLSSSH